MCVLTSLGVSICTFYLHAMLQSQQKIKWDQSAVEIQLLKAEEI